MGLAVVFDLNVSVRLSTTQHIVRWLRVIWTFQWRMETQSWGDSNWTSGGLQGRPDEGERILKGIVHLLRKAQNRAINTNVKHGRLDKHHVWYRYQTPYACRTFLNHFGWADPRSILQLYYTYLSTYFLTAGKKVRKRWLRKIFPTILSFNLWLCLWKKSIWVIFLIAVANHPAGGGGVGRSRRGRVGIFFPEHENTSAD